MVRFESFDAELNNIPHKPEDTAGADSETLTDEQHGMRAADTITPEEKYAEYDEKYGDTVEETPLRWRSGKSKAPLTRLKRQGY